MGDDTKAGEQGHTETAATAEATDTTKEGTKAGAKAETAKTDGKETTTETSTETKTDGPPEKYSIVVSDAGRVHFDDDDLKELETNCREAGFTNEQAQAYLDESIASAEAISARYLAQTKRDKEYGGDKLEETQKFVKAGIDLLRPVGHPRRESFMRFLNRAGAGNHIEVVSALADLGRRASEDTATGGTGAQGRQKTAESVLYGRTSAT